MSLEQKVIELLHRRSWSQSDLARRLGVRQQNVNRFIKSQQLAASALMAVRICKELRVPAEWLLDDSAPWPPPETQVTELKGPEFERLAAALENAAREIRGDGQPDVP